MVSEEQVNALRDAVDNVSILLLLKNFYYTFIQFKIINILLKS